MPLRLARGRAGRAFHDPGGGRGRPAAEAARRCPPRPPGRSTRWPAPASAPDGGGHARSRLPRRRSKARAPQPTRPGPTRPAAGAPPRTDRRRRARPRRPAPSRTDRSRPPPCRAAERTSRPGSPAGSRPRRTRDRRPRTTRLGGPLWSGWASSSPARGRTGFRGAVAGTGKGPPRRHAPDRLTKANVTWPGMFHLGTPRSRRPRTLPVASLHQTNRARVSPLRALRPGAG